MKFFPRVGLFWQALAGAFVGKLLAGLFIAVCTLVALGPDQWAQWLIGDIPAWASLLTPGRLRASLAILGVLTLFALLRSPRAQTESVGNRHLLTDLNALRSDPCPLFAKIATDKYNEIDSFIADHNNGRVEIHNLEQAFSSLEFIFCNMAEIHEILATSYGELREWRNERNWWMANYLRIHDLAIARGKTIRRIFITNSKEEELVNKTAFDDNVNRGIQVKTALRKRISNQDMHEAGNCLIFCRSSGEAIYCMQATHEAGEFEKVVIYRDRQHMGPLVAAYKRINANAISYQSTTIEARAPLAPT